MFFILQSQGCTGGRGPESPCRWVFSGRGHLQDLAVYPGGSRVCGVLSHRPWPPSPTCALGPLVQRCSEATLGCGPAVASGAPAAQESSSSLFGKQEPAAWQLGRLLLGSGFEAQYLCLSFTWPWASFYTLGSLSFLICKTGLTPILPRGADVKVKWDWAWLAQCPAPGEVKIGLLINILWEPCVASGIHALSV